MSGFRILNEDEHNGDRALAGRHTLTVGQNKTLVSRVRRHEISDDDEAGLYDRLTNGRSIEVWAWMVDIQSVQVSCSPNKTYLQEPKMLPSCCMVC